MWPRVWLAAVWLVAAGLVVSCSAGDDPAVDEPVPAVVQLQQSQSEPVAAPAPTEQEQQPAPTRAPSDPVRLLAAEASALEHNGYWEQALAARQSAIDAVGTLDADELAALRLDNVRLLLRLDRPGDAQAALDAVGPESSGRSLLLQAQTALARSDREAAVSAMEAYVNQDSPAWAQIALEIARTLDAAGRGAEAIPWAERALGGDLASRDELRALHLAATQLDILGEAERALAHYDRLFLTSLWRDDQSLALSRSAALQRDRGDNQAAQVAWQRLIESYPEFEVSWQALDRLLEAGVEVNQLQIGRIRFEQQRWSDARNAFLNLLGTSGDLSEQVAGEFYIAAIHEANGDLDSARLGYVAVIERDVSDPLAGAAAIKLADMAIAAGDVLTAERYWYLVMSTHPFVDRALEAGRRWALLAVQRGEWSEARERFREAFDTVGQGVDAGYERASAEFLLWQALMSEQLGETDRAAELAAAVIDHGESTIYAEHARVMLGEPAPDVLDIGIEEWLLRLTGDTAASSTDVERLPRWRAARDLRLGGFDDAADRIWSELAGELRDDPWSLVQAAQRLSELGEHTASVRMASELTYKFELGWYETPPALLRLILPKPWPEVMALHATAEGVDPLLLWSLIRQESLYDADAEGGAGEIGLTQVIPLTGSDIAAGLGVEYEHTDLARPELAIRFGAWYLARQLDGFGNEPIKALAAYNAGPGNAARWESGAVWDDPYGFLAALDFPSTRSYVLNVLSAWRAYQALERVSETP